jgi:hypothetical protein
MEIFSLSFLDAICCGFGAVIMLLVLNKVGEPRIIEQARIAREGSVAALVRELAEIRGEAAALDREMTAVRDEASRDRRRLATLQADLDGVAGKVRAASRPDEDAERTGELLAARQRLTEEMRRLLADYVPPKTEAAIGGVPVDSEYIIFIIDTSGSMQSGAWPLVRRKVGEALSIYPTVKGIQVMSDNAGYLYPSSRGTWLRDSPRMRADIGRALANWAPFSDSNPTDGIEAAIKTYYQPGRRISIYFLGDDFAGNESIERAIRFIERVNPVDAEGRRLVRIHAIGFPVQLAGGNATNFARFATFMRALSERSDGSFIAVPEVALQQTRIEIRGPGGR